MLQSSKKGARSTIFLIACTDNLNGFSQAIEVTFPQTEIQKCIVHQIRNSIRFVGYKDLKAITAELKPIYKASTEELATFFKYPAELRRIIYTTNVIGGFHRQLRKPTKSKSVFPSDESLLKMLYLITMDATKKWTMKVHNWGQILSQFVIFFEKRVTDYI